MELYYFWKENCVPCASAKPVVVQVAKSLKIPVTWLDARSPEGERLLIPFGILAVPTLVVVNNGHKVGDIVGADLLHATKLQKRLEKFHD